MTDKQIIIDVTQCQYLSNTGLCRLIYNLSEKSYDCSMCNENHNCYYKQLKRSEAQCEAMFVSHTDLEKKYKAKEQECEELKKGYAELTDIVAPYMDDFTGYNEELGGFDIVLCVKQLMEQLDQLKAENEGFKILHKSDKGLITSIGKQNYQLLQEYDKLKTALTEIKEIAEHCIKQDICTICDYSDKCHIEDEEIPTYDVCKLILQKISECEGNDETN